MSSIFTKDENNLLTPNFEFAISQDYIKSKIKYNKGTTTLSFIFNEGIIVAVDSRATSGSYIASQQVNKVIDINKYLLGTMAGGAADCYYLLKMMGMTAKKHELEFGKRISVSQASLSVSDYLYQNRGKGLSVGSMICGYDENDPRIFYIDDSGNRLSSNMFSVGSGSPIAYGILSNGYNFDMNKEEAIKLAKDAIYEAGHRDAMSGGTVNIFFMNKDGWTKLGRYDFNQLRDEYESSE